MSEQATYKIFCERYQLDPANEESKSDYQKYCDNLSMFASLSNDTEAETGTPNLIEVSPIEFGRMMTGHKNSYPLEAVGSIQCEDEKGVFYVPTATEYTSDGTQLYTAGNRDGYETRKELCEFIGRCWDLAED